MNLSDAMQELDVDGMIWQDGTPVATSYAAEEVLIGWWLRNCPAGQEFQAKYNFDGNPNVAAFEQQFKFHAMPVTLENADYIFRQLKNSGKLKTAAQLQKESQEAADRDKPRGKDGRVLSQSQVEWGEMTRWANEHSSEQCRQRARTDAKFASFVRHNLEREVIKQVGDDVMPYNEHLTPVAKTDPDADQFQALREFAFHYRQTPAAYLRPVNGFVTVAGERYPYKQFADIVNECAAQNLL